MESSSDRKLAAILFVDIQGYTALMQKDEEHASSLLRRFQDELTQQVRSKDGNIVNFYGDGALCTFKNPLEAMRCAMAFQSTFQSQPQVPVRAGIHLGTIVIENGKAYGDSINIASRIESLAIPGSILFSKRVQDELKNRPEFQTQSLGEFHFKNVEQPMEIYALANPGYALPKREEIEGKVKSQTINTKSKWYLYLIAGVILLSCISIFVHNIVRGTYNPKGITTGTLKRLAVLPFSNLAKDPDSDFLGLALADEIIGDLSYVKDVLVRPSSAILKYVNTIMDAPTVGDELMVDYILGGTFLTEGNKIRMDIELVNVATNEMIWREEIEDEYRNAFELQDRVSEIVLKELKIQFTDGESDHRKADVSDNPLAYEYYLRALAQSSSVEDNQLAVELLNQSINLDPVFAPAWSELGWRIKQLAAFKIGEGQQISIAEEKLEKALSLNQDLLSALSHLATIFVETGRIDKATETARRALVINPNNALNHTALGYAYRYAGFLDEAEKEAELALMLEPDNSRLKVDMGITQIYLGKYEKALQHFELSGQNAFSLAWQGQLHFRMGDEERAQHLLNKVIELDREGVGHWASVITNYLDGNIEKGFEALSKLEKDLVDPEQIYNIANQYSLLGYKEHCIRNLRKAVSRGFFNYSVLQNDPFLDSVRDEPAFIEVLEEAKMKHEAFGKWYF